MIKKIANSNKALSVLGASLFLAGLALAIVVGKTDSPTTNENVPLALFFGWTGILALIMTWSLTLERLQICVTTIVLTAISSLFGLELISVARDFAWPLIGAWTLCVSGGSLIGALLLARKS